MTANGPNFRRRTAIGIIAATAMAVAVPGIALADTAAEIATKSRAALDELYRDNPKAAEVGSRAKGVMIFPHIIKAGFVIAGASGDGALFINKKAVKYYNMSSASVGLQAGGQGYSYALFFMNDAKLAEAQKNANWDVGSDPNVVLIDAGAAKELDTRSLDKEVYAFVFGQKGLMAGISLKGTRTKEIHPK